MSEQMTLDLPSRGRGFGAGDRADERHLAGRRRRRLDRYRRRADRAVRRHRLPALYQGRAHSVAPRHRGRGEPDRAHGAARTSSPRPKQLVNDAHAEAVQSFLAANDLQPGNLAAVGFHGQTLLHRPERGLTVQIGDGRALAARLGIPVVYDFRAADVAAGGQGAPLAPIFHRALVRQLGREPPVAVLNVGGVANVTYIDGDELIACDTGPGNALLDDFLRLRTGRPLDTDGRKAAAGTVDEAHDRASAGASVLRAAAAEIARPQRFPRLGRRHARRHRRRERRGDADRAHRGRGGAHRAASAARAENLDRRRRRRAQSDADAHARRAACAGARRDRRMRSAGRSIHSRRRPSPISRCAACAACRSRFPARPARRARSPAACWRSLRVPRSVC